MPLWKKLVYGFVLANLVAMAMVTFVLPGIIRNAATQWVAENTDRTLVISDLRLNPLNWETTIEGLVLSEAGSDRPFVSFERLAFHVSPRSVWEWAPVITGLELEQPKIELVRKTDGSFNFSDLMHPGGAAEAAPAADEKGAGTFRFALNNLVVHDGEADFTDLAKPEVTHTIRQLEIALPFLGNTPALAERFVEPHLSLRLDDAPIVASGEVKPFAKTLDTSLGLALNNIDLPFYAAYLPDVRRFKVDSGHLALDLHLDYHIDADNVPQLILSGGVTVSALRVLDQRDKDLFFLPLMRIALDRATLVTREVAIASIDVYGLELFIDRGRDGIWNHARLANDPMFATPQSSAKPASGADEASPLNLTLAALRLRDGKLHFLDQLPVDGFRKEISDINLDFESFSLAPDKVSPYRLSLVVAEDKPELNGSVEVSGDVKLSPLAVTAHVKGRTLQLAGAEVYRPSLLKAYFASGHIDTDLDLQLKAGAAAPVISVAGEIGVRGLRIREPVLKSDILSWENLQLSGLRLDLDAGAPRLSLKEVVLNNYLAEVLVTRDGDVNLSHAVESRPADVESGAKPAAEAVAASTPPAETVPAPEIKVETVVLQGGTLAFIDEHMQRPFKTRLTELGGRISGLDSTSGVPADVDLRGSLNTISPLKITGGFNPFETGLFADLKIRFDAIDLTQATPYSGTYLGYAIEKGKLYLDLDYKIDGAKLDAGNRVFLDQFTFGQRVESDQATALPVRLAVALLKDRSGEIHLDLPVSGSLDDPQFSIVGVTFTIIKNLLVKAITSPFALLASLIGGGEDFSAIYFEYGHGELSPAEQDKLISLNKALQERPGLRVEVSGYVDAENDPEGYRQAELERKMSAAAGKKPGEVLAGDARSRALKRVYADADFPKPRNMFGLVKSLPDEEMEKLILANTPAGEPEMQALAAARAQVVLENLVQVQGLPPERVFLKQADIYDKGDADAARLARVGFGVGVD